HGVERDAGILDVGAGDRLPIVDRRRGGVPAVLRVQAVGEQDDDVLILVVWVLGRHGERRIGQRLPAERETDRLVGVAGGDHGIDLGVQRRPVVAQPHHLHRTGRILLGRELGAASTQNCRRRIQGVEVLVTVGDAAVPGVVVLRRPDRVVRLAGALAGIGVVAAGAVGGIPVGPVDPVRIVVAGAHIDVFYERNDRD